MQNHPTDDPTVAKANQAQIKVYAEKLSKLTFDAIAAGRQAEISVFISGMMASAMADAAKPCPVSGIIRSVTGPPHGPRGCDACFRDFIAPRIANVEARQALFDNTIPIRPTQKGALA